MATQRTVRSGGTPPTCPPVDTISTHKAQLVQSSLDSDNTVGISIHGWNIISVNSSINNETEMDDLSNLLYSAQQANKPGTNATDTNEEDTANTNTPPQPMKKFNPPEIVYGNAYVELHHIATNCTFKLTANDALLDWVLAHGNGSSQVGHQIKTLDAKLWSERRLNEKLEQQGSTNTAISMPITTTATIETRGEFDYDWTFSTPFAGRVSPSSTSTTNLSWISLPTSGIANHNHLLTDRSVPILYFHQVHLYEDDLHDNGDTSLVVKIRVMPTCWYVLMRLFLRVDHVLVRVRDTRFLHVFEDDKEGEFDSSKVRIYRDVCWREVAFDEMHKYGLPGSSSSSHDNSNHDLKVWRDEDRYQQFIPQIPMVDLPSHLSQFAHVDLSST